MPSSTPNPRPYYHFITPLFHRQLIRSLLLSYCLCYIVSCLLVRSFSIWAIQPVSIAGLRSLALLLCSIAVYIIRLWSTQSGRTVTKSPFHSFCRALLSPNLGFVNACLYLSSSMCFVEIAIFSAPENYKLNMIDIGGHADRPQINERALLFRSEFVILAFVQVFYHYLNNVDQVLLPNDKRNARSALITLQADAGKMAVELCKTAFVKLSSSLVLGWFLYSNFYRFTLWSWTFNIFKFYHDFPRNSAPRAHGVIAVYQLQFMYICYAFLLTLIWDTTNVLFPLMIAEPPIKKGAPITNDSKDPNGSLLSGLRSRRPLHKALAFWELSLISNQYDQRRVSIYQELDRKNGTTWLQVYTLGISQLNGIHDRIKAFKGEVPPTPPPIKAEGQSTGIGVQPKNDNIITPAKQPRTLSGKAVSLAGSIAKTQGSNFGGPSPAYELIGKPVQSLVEKTPLFNIQERQTSAIDFLLQLPIAAPFRQTFSRRIHCIVCDSPSSRASIIIDAINMLTALAVKSLKEDHPGQVQKNIGDIARKFASTIQEIDKLIKITNPHWTDIYFRAGQRFEIPEVDEITTALKSGLEEILRAFGEYFTVLGIPKQEVDGWKKLVARAPKSATGRPVTPPVSTKR